MFRGSFVLQRCRPTKPGCFCAHESFVLLHTHIRGSFTHFCTLLLTCNCALLRSFVCFCIRPRLERPRFPVLPFLVLGGVPFFHSKEFPFFCWVSLLFQGFEGSIELNPACLKGALLKGAFWLLTCFGGKHPLPCQVFKVDLYCLQDKNYSRRLLGGEKC